LDVESILELTAEHSKTGNPNNDAGYGRIDAFDSLFYNVKPTGYFTASVNIGNAPLLVKFADYSNYAKQWYWSFGDGGSSTERNPMHIYTKPGIYYVYLKVDNKYGTFTTNPTIITVRYDTDTILTSSTIKTTFGDTVELTAEVRPTTGQTKPSGTVSYYDGTRFLGSLTLIPGGKTKQTTNDLSIGSHLITAKYSGGSNFNPSTSKPLKITVVEKVYFYPNASFTVSTGSGPAPLKVVFTDKSTAGLFGGSITSWDWDFGDNSAHKTTQNAIHTYNLIGVYNVTLKIKTSKFSIGGKRIESETAAYEKIIVNKGKTPPPETP
jgi:PKD repeat protein